MKFFSNLFDQIFWRFHSMAGYFLISRLMKKKQDTMFLSEIEAMIQTPTGEHPHKIVTILRNYNFSRFPLHADSAHLEILSKMIKDMPSEIVPKAIRDKLDDDIKTAGIKREEELKGMIEKMMDHHLVVFKNLNSKGGMEGAVVKALNITTKMSVIARIASKKNIEEETITVFPVAERSRYLGENFENVDSLKNARSFESGGSTGE